MYLLGTTVHYQRHGVWIQGGIGCDLFKALLLGTPILVIGIRRHNSSRHSRMNLEKVHEARRVAEGKGLKQESVDDAENSRVCPDAESKRQDCRKRKSRRFPQLAQRIAKIPQQGLHGFPPQVSNETVYRAILSRTTAKY